MLYVAAAEQSTKLMYSELMLWISVCGGSSMFDSITVRNDVVRRRTGQSTLSSIVKLRRLSLFWARTWLVCMGIRRRKQLFEPTPRLWRRLLGRLRSTWLKNITDDLTAFDMRLLETQHTTRSIFIEAAGVASHSAT